MGHLTGLLEPSRRPANLNSATMTGTSLHRHTDLRAFFFDALEAAEGETSLGEELGAYVVHLLSGLARRTGLSGRRAPALALDYLSAREQGAPALRAVGDRALYISGVVPRSMDRTPVNLRYVRGIGESAYAEVYDRCGRKIQVFEQLADRFDECADVISRMFGLDDEENLLAVYERWVRTRDPADARRLARAGIRVDGTPVDTPQ